MLQKSFLGLLILSGVYLLIRILNGNTTGRVNNVPKAIQDAFNEAFDGSPYEALKDNWLAVSKMETAGWASDLFNKANNLWGMMRPKVRPNTASGFLMGNREWAKYDTVKDAVKDILLWMDYTKFPRKPLSIENHIAEMKQRKYFEEPDEQYLAAVKAWESR